MTERSTVAALSHSLATIVGSSDTPEALAALVEDCAGCYPADGVAVLVRDADRGLAPLGASSHTAESLELLQLQVDRGPCIEALRTRSFVWAQGEEMVRRWGPFGRAVLDAGHHAVHAYPIYWREQPIGGLNVFVSTEGEPTSDTRLLGRLFADLASLVVTEPGALSSDGVAARVHAAVGSRRTVERAKGVIAHREGLDIAAAHEFLLARARAAGLPLGQLAQQVLDTIDTIDTRAE